MPRPCVHLMYTLNGQHFECSVDLQTTQPNFGGLRWWFVSPLCERCAQKLFLPPDADGFGCRTCHKLSYASRSEKPFHRSMERARKIQLRFGGSPSLLDPFPTKPKGMWRKTYRRLFRECAAHESTMLRLLMAGTSDSERRPKEGNPHPAITEDRAGVSPTKPTKPRQRLALVTIESSSNF